MTLASGTDFSLVSSNLGRKGKAAGWCPCRSAGWDLGWSQVDGPGLCVVPAWTSFIRDPSARTEAAFLGTKGGYYRALRGAPLSHPFDLLSTPSSDALGCDCDTASKWDVFTACR